MKDLIKKWWFWTIIILVVVVVILIIKSINTTQTFQNSENIENNIQSHLNEFTYNYETGEVEYRPTQITLEMYSRINEGMNEKEVIQILGVGEKLEGENTYMISWGDINMSKGYTIQIIFNTNNEVISKSQIGLK